MKGFLRTLHRLKVTKTNSKSGRDQDDTNNQNNDTWEGCK
jgi:hypothetical protein